MDNYPYNLQLRRAMRERLAVFEPRAKPESDLRSAAVALTVVGDRHQASLVLTRRAGSLRAHSGQWALPGGRLDRGENAEMAALRELREEVNLALPPRAVLGRLDDYITRSGYRITPVVVWGGLSSQKLVPNPGEVASIDMVSFAELAKPSAKVTERIAQSDRPVLSMRLGVGRIYAPTAALLYQFCEVIIGGRDTRVAHYEQPVFAWR